MHQHSSESNIKESSDESPNNKWDLPDPQRVHNNWTNSTQHTSLSKQGNVKENIFEFLLFGFRFNPCLPITREIVQEVFDMFLLYNSKE